MKEGIGALLFLIHLKGCIIFCYILVKNISLKIYFVPSILSSAGERTPHWRRLEALIRYSAAILDQASLFPRLPELSSPWLGLSRLRSTIITMAGMPFHSTLFRFRTLTPTTALNDHHDKKQHQSYPELLRVVLLRFRYL